ncbi:hypothetical protein [Streptomyces sp. CB01580]|uniref:hypothetical protein n=1 Tax=Streptomyces sp. CB01580 TaxID=1703933 RepID=UPI00093F3BF4|nr:hypothetical protein [Streptomyces sp. CB01580]OKJ40081.1 hypothetical protein AMK22_11135 [Streptomyces sp. CB01580]
MKKNLSMAASLAIATTCALGLALPAHAAATGPTAVTGRSLPSSVDASGMDPQTKAIVDKIQAKLPADWESRLSATRAKYGLNESPWSEIRDSVINPGDHQCQRTELTTYAGSLLDGAHSGIVGNLRFYGGFDWASFDALIYGTESKSNTFGVNGEYTQKLTAEAKNLKRFWDIDSAGIQVIPMHGKDVLSSPERLAHTLSVMYGNPIDEAPREWALGLAELFIELVDSDPVLQGGANPMFTFNAFAYSEKGDPEPFGISERIVMGDGILQGMTAVGLGDVAPKGILGHEFAHHVQFQKDLFESDLTGPEATRRTELMADAFATYYLTHARGESLNATRLLKSAKSFYQVGDCSFTSSGHHGTPDQRFNSATWAAGVANDAANQGHILPSLKLDELFEAKLPDLVKPDAG